MNTTIRSPLPRASFRSFLISLFHLKNRWAYRQRLLYKPFSIMESPAQSAASRNQKAEDVEQALLTWIDAYKRKNDQEAFRKIFTYYREKLWQKLHLRRFYGYDPEDMFQEVNCDVARFLKHETPSNLMGLVYRIADHKIIDYLRSKAHRRDRVVHISLEEEESYLASGLIEQVDWSKAYDLQRFLFSKFINAKQREVLVLHFLLGHTAGEIQAQTGIPLNTVKSRLREGLRKLRLYFSK